MDHDSRCAAAGEGPECNPTPNQRPVGDQSCRVEIQSLPLLVCRDPTLCQPNWQLQSSGCPDQAKSEWETQRAPYGVHLDCEIPIQLACQLEPPSGTVTQQNHRAGFQENARWSLIPPM